MAAQRYSVTRWYKSQCANEQVTVAGRNLMVMVLVDLSDVNRLGSNLINLHVTKLQADAHQEFFFGRGLTLWLQAF